MPSTRTTGDPGDKGAAATRAQIVKVADELFYHQGFEHTSFSAIADRVGISRGNFYYHFKTKDDILAAVIECRLAATRRMLAQWESESDSPAGRILRFVDIVVTNGQQIQAYGCPVGTLTAELAKLQHASREEAVGVFALFRDWLRSQFADLGLTHDADGLALHVLAASQGIATLSNAFRDPEFVQREVERLHDWLESRMSCRLARVDHR
jgi:TetR/AcrR family transcriptional regulator, transcriptional repressor for nem operon